MKPAASPKMVGSFSLPLVWIVPLVALAVGGWLILKTVRENGPLIAIDFDDATGLDEGKTLVKFKGGTVGTVKSVELREDLRRVRVQVRLNQSAAALAREGSRFWIARPQIGFSGVSGLDTLLTGVQIRVRAGSGAPAKQFDGLRRSPPPEHSKEGRAFLLRSTRLGSLSPGSPVFYREYKVGEVETSRLADDATAVIVRIRIEPPYVDLVHADTRFWNAGGLSFKIGLTGAELKNTSLESLLNGGVAFATPASENGEPSSAIAEEEAVFNVLEEPRKEWLSWQPKIPIQALETGPDQNARPKNLSDILIRK